MRMDWPSERAACGSFFDPNSTISTTATIRIFHGLSNRSPIMSVLLLRPGWNEFGPGRPADGSAILGRPVMAKEGGAMAVAAAGRGHLRVSHADRERVISALK